MDILERQAFPISSYTRSPAMPLRKNHLLD